MQVDSAVRPVVPVDPLSASLTPDEGLGASVERTPPALQSNPVLDRFWVAVRRLPRYLRLAANLARDSDVPISAKAALAVGGIYTISPVDLVPGIVPVAGQLDDLIVLLFALRTATRACPPEIAAAHLQKAGLSREDFDTDLAAAKETALWVAGKGIKASRALASRGGRKIAALWRDHIGPA
jgi:uncharacterized membrane protein YkvA (DUF1232 family)